LTTGFFAYINKVMAIRRCPYCKAIIDEGLEYCSNCGTQLIFPEDEFIDEEIPGEKVVDVGDEESEPEEDEVSKAAEGIAAALKDKEAENADKFTEEDLKVEDSELIEDREREVGTSEVSDEEEIAPDEETDITADTEETFVETGELDEKVPIEIRSTEIPVDVKESTGFEDGVLPDETDKPTGGEVSPELEPPKEAELPEEQASDTTEQAEEDAVPDSEEIRQVEDVFAGEEEGTGEIVAEGDSVDFKTEDLEKIVDPAEKEKEEIEQFLNSLKEEREKTKKYYEETGELPPWAQSMKDGSLSSLSSEEEIKDAEKALPTEEEKYEEEKKPLEEEKFIKEEEPLEENIPPAEDVAVPSDTGMGLPEKIDQKGLPFSQSFQEDDSEEAGLHFKHKDMGFPSWIKSRVFDVLMIIGIWLVSVWLASVVADVSFFTLITVSTLPILIFLAILLTVYFFLFFFFLGETLGDQLFSQEE
jgi:hypothetical protein